MNTLRIILILVAAFNLAGAIGTKNVSGMCGWASVISIVGAKLLQACFDSQGRIRW